MCLSSSSSELLSLINYSLVMFAYSVLFCLLLYGHCIHVIVYYTVLSCVLDCVICALCMTMYEQPLAEWPLKFHFTLLHFTDTHTHTKAKGCKVLTNGICPARPINAGTPVRYFRERWAYIALDKLLKPGQALAGAMTSYSPPLWCGHPKSHLYLSGIRHSQWPCPSPA